MDTSAILGNAPSSSPCGAGSGRSRRSVSGPAGRAVARRPRDGRRCPRAARQAPQRARGLLRSAGCRTPPSVRRVFPRSSCVPAPPCPRRSVCRVHRDAGMGLHHRCDDQALVSEEDFIAAQGIRAAPRRRGRYVALPAGRAVALRDLPRRLESCWSNDPRPPRGCPAHRRHRRHPPRLKVPSSRRLGSLRPRDVWARARTTIDELRCLWMARWRGHEPTDLVREFGHACSAEQYGEILRRAGGPSGAGCLLAYDLQDGGRAEVELIKQEVVR
jgi:hypothetical protein